MRFLGGLGWVAGAVTALLVIAPIAALVPGALVDRAPSGSLHGTLLYLALAASDPFVWTCAWHSLTVAIVVSVASWLLGIALARGTTRWRFWGRQPLAALAWAPLAVPPVVAALGVRGLLARTGPLPGGGVDVRAWLGWVWVALCSGVPLVALVTAAALRRVDPAWEDAARLAGASRRRVWWNVAWPLARPDASRALAAVFTAALADPVGPLFFGLRRTLSYQIVEDILAGPSHTPRAAALTLIAIGLIAFGRLLLRWWGHARWPELPIGLVPNAPRARALRALLLALGIAAWAILGLIPLWDVARSAAAIIPPEATLSDLSGDWARRLVNDPELRQPAVNSFGFGLGTGLIALGLAWGLAAPAARCPNRWTRLRAAIGHLPEAMPPLAFGVGLIALVRWLDMLADLGASGRSPIAFACRAISSAVDPYRAPGVALLCALAATHLPMLLRASELGFREARPALGEAARTLGASDLRARRSLWAFWLGSAPSAALVVTCALAATSVAAAILLAPTSESRPLGPSILLLADAPAGGLERAALLATMAFFVNLMAFGFASRRRVAPFGGWFRN
jgi:iron(III) transport system permease protein